MSAIDPRLVEVALEHCSEKSFERFGQAMLSAILGVDFVPTGGVHDGGLDGFDDCMLSPKNRITAFFQITKEQDARRKIRKTVKRLAESGRSPNELTLVTSRTVDAVDLEEETLSQDLGISIRIRDRKWLSANINRNSATQAAFAGNLASEIQFLSHFGATRIASNLPAGDARTVYVFLAQEVDRRRGDTQLLEAVVDSLILWSLEGTDPDKEILRNRAEISARILEVFPSAKQFLPGVLNFRLETLAAKQPSSGRQVRWHKKEDRFCLPYETRTLLELENVEDEALRLAVQDIFCARAKEYDTTNGHSLTADLVADLANKTVEKAFEAQGLDLAAFLTDGTPTRPPIFVSDHADAVLSATGLLGDDAVTAKEAIIEVLRGAFYSSTESERRYFGKLSRTYTLFLSLRTEPRIVEYFRSMSTKLTLYVGSDLLVLALSEYFLPKEDQMVNNMLEVVRKAGATLILAEPVLDEVLGQFRASEGEYRAVFQRIDKFVTKDLVRHADRILVRTYFYARLDARTKVPATWAGFVDLFLNYTDLRTPKANEGLRRYLCNRFRLTYENREDMLQGVNETRLTDLAVRLEGTKVGDHAAERAHNDAALALAVYAKRRRNQEMGSGNPYGYTTWWLTKEFRIRAETAELVRKEGARFLMVPEFLLNFIALAPSAAEVRTTFEKVFPTRLGIRLSNRMREDVFQDVMRKVNEADSVDQDRLEAKVAELSDRLKGDRFKQYERHFPTLR